MRELENTSPASDALAGNPHWELVRRVAASAHFQRSVRLREFLLYIADRTLRKHLDEVTEQQIGCHVFGRRPDYSAGEDNIVRSQARLLRLKLQDYFATEGHHEPVVIEIPKGSYVPVFAPRAAVISEVPAEAGRKPARRRWPMPALAILCALLALVSVWLWRQNARLRTAAEDDMPAFPWSGLFDGKRPTTIVAADSCLALLQDITRHHITLKDYVTPELFAQLKSSRQGRETQELIALVSARQFTSYADLNLASRLLLLSGRYRERAVVRFARNVQVRDFKTGNFILLGSSRSNPWQELFEQRRNFHCAFDEQDRKPYFRNKAPRQGEQSVYLTSGKDGKPGETFGALAFLPNMEHDGNILIIEGTNMEGTEAAGEYLTNRETVSKLLQALGMAATGTRPRYFEVLLRTSAMAGTSRDTEIVASRVLGEARLVTSPR